MKAQARLYLTYDIPLMRLVLIAMMTMIRNDRTLVLMINTLIIVITGCIQNTHHLDPVLESRILIMSSAILFRENDPDTYTAHTTTKMDACSAVEREIDKVLSKFTSYSDHASNTITNLRTNIESLRIEIDQGTWCV